MNRNITRHIKVFTKMNMKNNYSSIKKPSVNFSKKKKFKNIKRGIAFSVESESWRRWIP